MAPPTTDEDDLAPPPGGSGAALAKEPLRGLRRYKMIQLVGDGTYGLVYLAFNQETREKVAIKTMKKKYHSWGEVMDLREVKSLKKLSHPNIVKLKEVIRENNRLYFVFEYIKGDLLALMREWPDPFQESQIRTIVLQIFQALAYMHRNGFFHRDLKPENILCSNPEMVKIADFGLAREIRSSPPYTDYVSTRWYRAPEVLLRSTSYNSPIDVWATGCIMAELYTRRPLFPGTSEIDQIYKVCSVLGTPSSQDWSHGQQLASQMNFKFPTFSPTHLSQVLGSRVGARGISLMYTTLTWNPSWRSSATEVLKHSYFRTNSQPTSASSFSLMLRPSRSKRSKSEAESRTLQLNPVEPVYGRESLRNYRESPVSDQDQEELKQLLDSLQSSDVMQVKQTKQNNKHRLDRQDSSEHPKSTVRIKPNFLNYDHTQMSPTKLRLNRTSNISKQPPYNPIQPPYNSTSNIPKQPAYTPLFLQKKHQNGHMQFLDSLERDTNANPIVVGHTYKPSVANQNLTNGGPSYTKPYNPSTSTHLNLSNGGSQMSRGRGPLVNGHLPGKVQFTKDLVTNFSSKMDFKTKTLDSYTDMDLNQATSNGLSGLNGLLPKFRSLPNIKADTLVGSKKVMHTRSPFSSYVPSALESQSEAAQAKAKPVYVRTDWKAKYLT